MILNSMIWATNSDNQRGPGNDSCSIGMWFRGMWLRLVEALDHPLQIASTVGRCIFEEKWSDEASNPKFTPNSDAFWMHLFLNNRLFIFPV